MLISSLEEIYSKEVMIIKTIIIITVKHFGCSKQIFNHEIFFILVFLFQWKQRGAPP